MPEPSSSGLPRALRRAAVVAVVLSLVIAGSLAAVRAHDVLGLGFLGLMLGLGTVPLALLEERAALRPGTLARDAAVLALSAAIAYLVFVVAFAQVWYLDELLLRHDFQKALAAPRGMLDQALREPLNFVMPLVFVWPVAPLVLARVRGLGFSGQLLVATGGGGLGEFLMVLPRGLGLPTVAFVVSVGAGIGGALALLYWLADTAERRRAPST